MNVLTQAEGNILLFIQDHFRCTPATAFFKGVSFFGEYAWFFFFMVIMLLIFRKTRKLGVYCGISLALEVALNNGILKNLVARPRPYQFFPDLKLLGITPKDYSFPSGHAGAAFAVSFIFLWKAPKKYGIPMMVFACLIGISRLYLGAHFPTDVLAGVALGLITSFVSKCIVEAWEKRHPKKTSEQIKE